MKNLVLILALAAALPLRADQAAAIYKQGVTAVQDGNVQAAEAAFKEVLRLQPGNANARYQLNALRQNQGSLAARARARKLSEYTIGQIDFSKSEFSEAISALSLMVEEQSGGKFAPNFMIQDPSGSLGSREVTLQVKSVPAKAVFEMLLKQAGAIAKYEEHAIVIRPVARAGE